MHRVCLKCQRSVRELERFETDSRSGKRYLITSCIHCGFNFDIEEVTPPHGKKGWFKSDVD